MNLRRQLLLVSLLTLMLPWAGCEFIRETEKALRATQQQMLAGTARDVASALAQDAGVLMLDEATASVEMIEGMRRPRWTRPLRTPKSRPMEIANRMPRYPRSPIFLKMSWSGAIFCASHSSTCGLISLSTNSRTAFLIISCSLLK